MIEINYKKSSLENAGEIYVKYLFFKKKLFPREKKKETAEKATEEKSDTTAEKKDFDYYKSVLDSTARIFNLLKNDIVKLLDYITSKAVVIKNISFDFTFGLDEPMYTGILTGIVYGVVYNILGTVDAHTNLKKHCVNIKPDFDNICHSIQFDCILRLKNVHIIFILIKGIKLYKKLKKEMKGSN